MNLKKVSVLLVALLLVFGSVAFAETLLLDDSFSGYEEGQVPSGWYDPNAEDHAEANTSQQIVEFEDEKVLRVQSNPKSNGKLIHDFDFASGKVYVSFYQPADRDVTDNIYVDIKNADNQRIFGLFVTGSGNVRIRDAGAQSPNVYACDPGSWHTVMLEWDNDTQIYHAYAVWSADFYDRITPEEGARFDPNLSGGSVPAQLQFEIARRDVVKTAYYKDVMVYALD